MEFEALKIDLSGTAAQAPVESRHCVMTASLFLAITRSAMLWACRPGGCVFLTGPGSRCPHPALDASLTGCGKSGSLMTVLLNSVDGAARGLAKSIFSMRVWFKSTMSRRCNFQGWRFSRQCTNTCFCICGRLSFMLKDLYCSALRYLPLGRVDQILRRCMHTFECQLDSADRFGDVCRQSSVWLLKQVQSHVTNWATYCHLY